MTLSVTAMPVVDVIHCLHDVVSVADSGLLCCLVRSDVVRCRFLAWESLAGRQAGLHTDKHSPTQPPPTTQLQGGRHQRMTASTSDWRTLRYGGAKIVTTWWWDISFGVHTIIITTLTYLISISHHHTLINYSCTIIGLYNLHNNLSIISVLHRWNRWRMACIIPDNNIKSKPL